MENQRLLSLDAFRGFTIAAMILVNNPGSWSHVYPPLLHAKWNGLTPTDLIFPFFLFIVGVSIVLAYSKLLEKGVSRKSLYGKIAFRSLKIFLVGLALNYLHHFNITDLRYVGVLQRIAFVFFFASIIYLNTGWKMQVYLGATILVVYWLAMVLIPTPGYGKAMLEPGINLAAWADNRFLPGKLYEGTWDPEGLLSTFTSLATCIMGMLTGQLIKSKLSSDRKVIWLFLLGALAALAGYIWSWAFPINKNIWTSSYVLVCGGFAMLVLSASIFRIDMLQNTKLARLGIIFGSNAITIYVLADVLSRFVYHTPIGGAGLSEHFINLADTTLFSHKFLSMVFALVYIVLLFFPAWWLYKRRIFIKL